ncbi:hypothetical protein L3067_01535 [Xanthomonas sp. PPL568]|uniref:hypothetical protein n=1 Tax=Xanthomonas indica TaxID=2912242 RepID=UPI001F5AD455|nr:hypothetical protein [Xanthomonas indica]MCI2243292.1 hypothetical protein [Xanthomonas indica]
MNWLNPVRGDNYLRSEWQLMIVGVGETIRFATIQRCSDDATVGLLAINGKPGAAERLPLADAFDGAAEQARLLGRKPLIPS